MSNRSWIVICIVEALIIISLLLAITKPTVTSPDVIVKEVVRDSIIRDSIYIEIEKINEMAENGEIKYGCPFNIEEGNSDKGIGEDGNLYL